MTVLDKATRMAHLIACSKSVTAVQSARLYMTKVAKLHGISSILYSDRGTQFSCLKFLETTIGIVWDTV